MDCPNGAEGAGGGGLKLADCRLASLCDAKHSEKIYLYMQLGKLPPCGVYIYTKLGREDSFLMALTFPANSPTKITAPISTKTFMTASPGSSPKSPLELFILLPLGIRESNDRRVWKRIEYNALANNAAVVKIVQVNYKDFLSEERPMCPPKQSDA